MTVADGDEADPVLRAESVGKSFWTNRVLTSASLRLPAGCVTALLGRNGSGKTTLFRIAAGSLRADYGWIGFRGKRYRRPRLAKLARRGLFFLPDRELLPGGWCLERVIHLMSSRSRRGRGDVHRALEVLEALGIRSLAESRVGELSDGERRLASVAAAAVRAPRCLLADEPLRELSPASAGRVSGVLRRMAGEGAAVAVTGHERRELLVLADRVVWMTAGTTHELGRPAEAVDHPQFRREYLGPAPIPELDG